MAVYVDTPFAATVVNGGRRLKSRWCHMMADSEAELIEFAERIGLRRSWIQYPGTPRVHFDLTAGRRAAAVRNGAIEVTWREMGMMVKKRREAAS